jgi:hypothetical protein
MARQFLIPGSVYMNETAAKEYNVPGVAYLNDTTAEAPAGGVMYDTRGTWRGALRGELRGEMKMVR